MPYPFTVVDATPRLIQDYGYLYVFTCSRPYRNKDIKFLKMSQIFEKRPIPLSAKNIYVHFSSMQKKGIEPIVSLNRGNRDDGKPIRNEEWAIQKAKTYADQVRDKQKEEHLKTQDEPKKEYTSREDADTMIQKQKAEWAEEDKKKNWYQQARTFVRKLIQG